MNWLMGSHDKGLELGTRARVGGEGGSFCCSGAGFVNEVCLGHD